MQKITIPFSIILGLGRQGSRGRKIENVKLKLTKPGVFTLPNLEVKKRTLGGSSRVLSEGQREFSRRVRESSLAGSTRALAESQLFSWTQGDSISWALLAGSQLIPWLQGEKDPTREVRPFSGNWSDVGN